VQGERERLIPFVSAVVKSVDLARGELVVDWGADF
jgi:ribosomal 30S subunit maturation factor RimM